MLIEYTEDSPFPPATPGQKKSDCPSRTRDTLLGMPWLCTLDAGHEGRHEAALNDNEVAAHWDDEDASTEDTV